MSYLGHTPEEGDRMLAAVGISSVEELAAQIPAAQRMQEALDLPAGLSEHELRNDLEQLGRHNYDPAATPAFLGGGIYDHIVPALIDALVSRPEFATAYTPYQPEVAQGTLAAIYEFQTMICELTGMEVANASMYDGASAAAEALLLAVHATRGERVFLAEGVHPRTAGVIATYLDGSGVKLEHLSARDGCLQPEALEAAIAGGGGAVAGVLVQSPNVYGLLEPLDRLGPALQAHGRGSRRPHLVVSADPLSLGLLAAPGELGAETVVGDVQPLGIPAQFGGPTAGFLATRRAWVRRLPGRLVAEAQDAEGRRGYTLTLQTREQHIRREKATSNICTNSGLMMLRATIYLALVGPQGLREVAEQCLARSRYAFEKLAAVPGVERVYAGPFFREFVVRLPQSAARVVQRVYREANLLAGIPLERLMPERERPHDLLVAVTEKRSRDEIDALAMALETALG